MIRQEFINELRKELFGIPSGEIEDIIRDQEEMINDAIASGRNETAVIYSIGDPKELAKSLKAEIKIEKATDEKKLSKQMGSIFGAIGALLVLAPFNLIFVFGPFLAVLGVMCAGWAVAVALVCSAVVLLGLFFVKIIFVSAALTAHLSVFFGFLGIIGLSLLIVFGMYYATKLIFKLTISYLKWNLNFIKSRT